MSDTAVPDTDVAIVGMAGRFPGAPDVDELWRRVVAGDDCLTNLDPDQLLAAGVPASFVRAPSYVKRSGILDDVAGFDFEFFNIGARDAAVMDPQHRHFLECSWEALESSAVVPERFDGAIGVFGGCGMNTYLINNLLTNGKVLEQLGWFLLRHTGNDKDFLTNGVAYRLDLRGPAVNVQTACSTSLVAVHLAVQSLLAFETDLALAGGATIEFPHGQGYEFHEGEILAPDGVCRAFDARSEGTVLTSGVAVVALRRLADAIADGDPVLAVIKGTAINNDGSRKVSFLAPSVDGHAEVVREALTVAGLSARDLQLFEAHGTGTAVGDPIEIAAVGEAFRTFTADRNFCRVTSTKPNIGHLDTAAGTASLVKVVQALRHRTLPPLANHTAPSPLIDIARSPFVLTGTADPWPGDVPRRAGVSSLGVGGTNAHVVVEEAPEPDPSPVSVPEQVLPISAQTAAALDAASVRLAGHLAANTDLDLGAVSHTLVTGRRAMRHRRVVTATDVDTAVRVLGDNDRYRSAKSEVPDEPVRLGFMFPGGGSQYVGMGAGLDERFAVFHAARAEGVELVRQCGGPDLAPLLAPGGERAGLLPPTASLPSVFVTSIALARQWIEFGARPDLFIGHSLGEYAAAHLAGVMSYEDAVSIVVARSALMERDSGTGGAMLAVPLPEAELLEVLPATLDVAAINAADECVVAGPAAEVRQLADLLEQRGTPGTLLALSAAAHSSLLDPMLDELTEVVGAVTLHPPKIPYTSNLTGTWITSEQATSPKYWATHTRSTVRFADCVRTAVGDSALVLAELGPGQALSSFARRANPRPVAVIPSLRHPDHEIGDSAYTLQAFARQWASGVDVDLDQFNEGGRRVPLPTYPFQHQRCWIEPGTATLAAPVSAAATGAASAALERIDELDRACWTVPWIPATPIPAGQPDPEGRWWMIVGDEGDETTAAVAAELRLRQLRVQIVAGGTLDEVDADLSGIVVVAPTGPDHYREAFERWFTDATSAISALGSAPGPVRLIAVLRSALPANGLAMRPADAMALGVALVGQREYPNVATRVIDVDIETTVAAIVDEVLAEGDAVVAHRDGARLTPSPESALVPHPDDNAVTFREGGTYLVTGGLGGVGHVLAAHLATNHRASLVLVSSSEVPEGEARARWLATHAYDDPTSRRIRQLASLEQLGTKVAVVVADMGDPESVRTALDEAERQVGALTGAVHAAGQLRDALIEFASVDDHAAVLGAKANGALVLADELSRRSGELLLLVSSTSTVLTPAGQSSYVGANAVLDALAGRRDDMRVATINFGLWSEVGVASAIARRARLAIGDGEPVDHPVFSERRRERDGTTVLTGRVDADHHWVADEHRTAEGVAVYPGTGHLHLMTTAAELAGLADVQLVDVMLLSPLVVPEGTLVTVRADVSEGGLIEISSDCGSGDHWTLHSQAATAPRSADPVSGDPVAEFDALHVRDVELLGPQRVHMAFGPRWDAVVEARRGDGVVIAQLALPEGTADEAAVWSPHPAIVDVATAAGVALAPASVAVPLYVPTRYRRVRMFAPMPAKVLVRAVEVPSSTAEHLRVDLTVVDDAGDPVLVIDGLELLGTMDHAILERADDTAAGTPTAAPSLVELADDLGLRPAEGAELVERLLASDHDRIIGSTIDLGELLDRVAEDAGENVADAPTAPASAGSLESALSTMWADLLGIDQVGPDDDFFDLGGHSLIAIRMMSKIHQELGVRLQLTTIFDAPTVATLSARLRSDHPAIDAAFAAEAGASASAGVAATSPAEMTRHLVPISTKGAGQPLYVVHGAGGNILFLARFGRAMGEMRPVFGFQAHGVDGHDIPDASVEAMVDRYVEELRAHAPGPYLLGGYSGGGTVALEMSMRLRELGEQVDVVVLFDSPVGQISLGRMVHLRYLAGNLLRHGPGPVMPIVQSRLQETRVGRALLFGGEKSEHQQSHEANYQDMLSHGFHDLYDQFGEMVERYDVGTYDVDAILIKAQLRWPLMSSDYGWRDHITGRLQVIVAPGDHESMFHGAQVQEMVAELAPLLAGYD